MIREIYGKKIGMTQLFTDQGEVVAVTLVEVGPCRVLEEGTPENKAVVIGYEQVKKDKKKKRPEQGYFKKLNQEYFKYVKCTQKLKGEPLEQGKDVNAEIFSENELIDVTATSIGRGFQGGMKRHNWSGQPKSHGSTSHRRIGSVGASAYPSKIVKGLNMPGHMGNCKVTTKNLKVVKVDKEKNILFLKGSCPGARNSLMILRKQGL